MLRPVSQDGSSSTEGEGAVQEKSSIHSSSREETGCLRLGITQEEEAQSWQGGLLRVQTQCWWVTKTTNSLFWLTARWSEWLPRWVGSGFCMDGIHSNIVIVTPDSGTNPHCTCKGPHTPTRFKPTANLLYPTAPLPLVWPVWQKSCIEHTASMCCQGCADQHFHDQKTAWKIRLCISKQLLCYYYNYYVFITVFFKANRTCGF